MNPYKPQTAEDLIQQQKDIELVSNLARYLGKKSKYASVFVWTHEDLVVIVNDDDRYTIVLQGDEAVCSNQFNPPIFMPGPWLDVICKFKDQIKTHQLSNEREKTKHCVLADAV